MEKFIKYVPMGMFVAFGAKALFTQASFIDVAALLVLGATAGYYEWKSQNKEMQILHNRCNVIDKHLETLYKQNDEVKSYISGVKLAQQARNPFGAATTNAANNR